MERVEVAAVKDGRQLTRKRFLGHNEGLLGPVRPFFFFFSF